MSWKWHCGADFEDQEKKVMTGSLLRRDYSEACQNVLVAAETALWRNHT